jgi:hypothetical protein
MAVDLIEHQAMIKVNAGKNNSGLGRMILQLLPALADRALNRPLGVNILCLA